MSLPGPGESENTDFYVGTHFFECHGAGRERGARGGYIIHKEYAAAFGQQRDSGTGSERHALKARALLAAGARLTAAPAAAHHTALQPQGTRAGYLRGEQHGGIVTANPAPPPCGGHGNHYVTPPEEVRIAGTSQQIVHGVQGKLRTTGIFHLVDDTGENGRATVVNAHHGSFYINTAPEIAEQVVVTVARCPADKGEIPIPRS